MKNIYVGNLALSVSEETLRSLFEEKGQVSRVKIIQDKFTGQSRGFGFVEMSNDDEALNAINSLNGYVLEGRPLKVNEALEKRDTNGGGFGSRPQGGGGFGRGPRSGGSSGGAGGGWGGPRQKRY